MIEITLMLFVTLEEIVRNEASATRETLRWGGAMLLAALALNALVYFLTRRPQKLIQLVERPPIIWKEVPENPDVEILRKLASTQGVKKVPFVIHFPFKDGKPEAKIEAIAEFPREYSTPVVWIEGFDKPVRWKDRLTKASELVLKAREHEE